MFLEAVETARGINKPGNEYSRVNFSDGTYEYRYNLQSTIQGNIILNTMLPTL